MKITLLPKVPDFGCTHTHPHTHTYTHTHPHPQFEGTKANLDQSIPVPPSSDCPAGLITPLFSTKGHILFLSQFLLLAPMGAVCGSDYHRLSAGAYFEREGHEDLFPNRKPDTTSISLQMQTTSLSNC